MGTSMSVRTIGLSTHSSPRYVTPSRPEVNGSIPAMLIVPVGAIRLPDRRRSSVVFPAPFARRGQRSGEDLNNDTDKGP